MCALSDRARVACRPETRKKERKKREREKEGRATRDEDRDNPSPFLATRRKGWLERGRGCVCARASRGGTTERRGQCLDPRRVFEGVSRGQSFAPPPANNLLVFHVRFDSLSFRYLYLPGPLRISGISGISRAGGWGALRGLGGGGRKKKEKIKGGKNRTCTHEGGEGGVTVLE